MNKSPLPEFTSPFPAPEPGTMVFTAREMPVLGETSRSGEQISQLFDAAGSLAVGTEVTGSFQENWHNGGTGFASRLGTLLSRATYLATTPKADRETNPFSRDRPFGGQYSTLSSMLGRHTSTAIEQASTKIANNRRATRIEAYDFKRTLAHEDAKWAYKDLQTNPNNRGAARRFDRYSGRAERYTKKINNSVDAITHSKRVA